MNYIPISGWFYTNDWWFINTYYTDGESHCFFIYWYCNIILMINIRIYFYFITIKIPTTWLISDSNNLVTNTFPYISVSQ